MSAQKSVSMEPGVYVEKDANWHKQGWTAIPNALIRHPDLSADAKWAFCWLSSHTETFQITAEKLAEAGPKGRNHARGAIRELEQHGWLTREKVRNEQTGRYDVTKYYMHPIPVPLEDRTFVPSQAKARKFPERAATTAQSVADQEPGTDESVAGLTSENADDTEAESALFDLPGPSENPRSDPATDRPVPGPSVPGPSVTGESVALYEEEVTTGEHQLASLRELHGSAGAPPAAAHPSADAPGCLPLINGHADSRVVPFPTPVVDPTHHPRASRATARGGTA